MIRRVQRQIPQGKVLGVVHSLWLSKLRYGLQLCKRVQLTNEEKKCDLMKSLQLTQNRMLRTVNSSKIKDKISTVSLLKKFGRLSVNQLAAQIKRTEVWKSLNVAGHPNLLKPYNKASTSTTAGLRPKPTRILNDSSKLMCAKFSFHVDAARLWNLAPPTIKSADTLRKAKSAIMTHCKSLPI